MKCTRHRWFFFHLSLSLFVPKIINFTDLLIQVSISLDRLLFCCWCPISFANNFSFSSSPTLSSPHSLSVHHSTLVSVTAVTSSHLFLNSPSLHLLRQAVALRLAMLLAPSRRVSLISEPTADWQAAPTSPQLGRFHQQVFRRRRTRWRRRTWRRSPLPALRAAAHQGSSPPRKGNFSTWNDGRKSRCPREQQWRWQQQSKEHPQRHQQPPEQRSEHLLRCKR